jgi:hypothetical protein
MEKVPKSDKIFRLDFFIYIFFKVNPITKASFPEILVEEFPISYLFPPDSGNLPARIFKNLGILGKLRDFAKLLYVWTLI